MNSCLRTCAGFVGALLVTASLQAQTIQFRSSITGGQEVPATTSTATGSAVLIEDIATNTFDLVVTLNNFTGPLVASRIEEGAAGSAGTVVVNLGAEAAYVRTGNNLTATFHSIAFPAAKLPTLLRNGMFLNFTTAAAANGEIRGQLIAQPKRLYANIDVPQERAAFPTNANLATAGGFGAAVMTYDPGTNKLNLRVSVYNYPNTLTLSHYHQEAVGVSGSVVTNLGAGTVSNYVVNGNQFNGTFLNLDPGATSDPIKLLTGGQYLNFHSNINPSGEARGQVWASEETLGSRLINVSTRGFVSTTDSLVAGLIINGPEPVRVIFAARGPSLSAFGITNGLANPTLSVYDSQGRRMATNDDVGTVAAGSELSTIYGVPSNAVESCLVLVLPPGAYTAAVTSSNGGTGVALLEAFDVRNTNTVNANATGTVAELAPGFAPDTRTLEEFMADILLSERNPVLAARAISARALERCGIPVEPGKGVTPKQTIATSGR